MREKEGHALLTEATTGHTVCVVGLLEAYITSHHTTHITALTWKIRAPQKGTQECLSSFSSHRPEK